jgi:hypothetical protein
MKPVLWPFALGALVIASSCAGPRGPHRGGPPGAMPSGRAALVFVAPMGEPFRVAETGENALDLWFNAADADHDGVLSEAEFRADGLRYFVRLDANGDRTATSVESTAIYQREAPEVLAPAGGMGGAPRGRMGGGRPPGGGGPGGGGGPPGGGPGGRGPGGGGPQSGGGAFGPPDSGAQLQGAQRFGLLGDAEPVMSCDADLSRRVTQAEFEACIVARFANLDSDDDGVFQRSEARFWRERARGQRNSR